MAKAKKKKVPPVKKVALRLRIKGKFASQEAFFKYEAEKAGVFIESYKDAVKSSIKKYSNSKQIQKTASFEEYLQQVFSAIKKKGKDPVNFEVRYYQLRENHDVYYKDYRYFLNGKRISSDDFYFLLDLIEGNLPPKAFLFTILPKIDHSKKTIYLKIDQNELENQTKDKYGNYYIISN